MANGLRKGINQSTHTRADKKIGRVSVVLSEPKVVESLGSKRYTIVASDDFSRYTCAYFNVLQVGRRGIVGTVPRGYSCRRCSFQGGNRLICCCWQIPREKFGGLCRSRGIKQEFTTVDSLHSMG